MEGREVRQRKNGRKGGRGMDSDESVGRERLKHVEAERMGVEEVVSRGRGVIRVVDLGSSAGEETKRHHLLSLQLINDQWLEYIGGRIRDEEERMKSKAMGEEARRGIEGKKCGR